MDKVKQLVQSRKFWALVASLASIVAGMLASGANHLAAPDAIKLAVAAFAAYKVGTGLDSAGQVKTLPPNVITADSLERVAANLGSESVVKS